MMQQDQPKSNSQAIKGSRLWLFALLFFLLLVVVGLNLSYGSVKIPLGDILKVLTGQEGVKESWVYIIQNYRLPKIATAILAGIALSASGLQMQTMFRNPLADPFILGINSGASLGVALAIMGASLAGGLFVPALNAAGGLGLILAASIGAGLVMGLILLVGKRVNNPTSLLILGLMFGHATSALVSLLIYFSAPEKVKAYNIWSYGAFSGVTWEQLQLFFPVILAALGILFFLPKGLNGLLLGEDYAKTMGLNVDRLRLLILVSASILSGTVTAFCGPIGFIGVAVPHIARNIFKTSNHKLLIPAVILIGAVVAVTADLIAQLPGSQFVLPINVITSLFGAPFVLWIVLKKKAGCGILQRVNQPLLSTTDLEIGHLNGKPAKKVVASNLNLELYEGEFVCLVGPNGAGKSTLLRSMTGLLPVLGGEIEINGKKLAQFTRKELAYQISVVLTSPIEVGAMSVEELVAMGRFPFTGLFDRMSDKDWQIVQQALKMVGIEGFEGRLIHKLSDGERQKVMIARALAQEPRILILDEPTAYLDLPGRVSVMNLMRELSSEHGKTVLTSTHDLDLAMRSADRFWLMSAGGEIIQGAPEDLVLSGDFQRIFARDKVSFDSQNGHFSVANKGEEHVSLNGEGDARIWTERALQRIGFQVFDEIEGEPSLCVDIEEGREGVYWEVNDKRTSQRFGSLGDLTSYFRSLKNQDNLNSD